MVPWVQASLIGYNQIRTIEEDTIQFKFLAELFKAMYAAKGS